MIYDPISPVEDSCELQKESTPYAPSDETLLVLLTQAKEGSLEACQRLRNRYRPLIDASVSRFASSELTKQEYQDLREEAERIFLNAISTYDTEQDAVDFGLYTKICLKNGLISEMRSLVAHRRIGIVPLDNQDVPAEEDPGHALVEAERFHRLYDLISKHLSELENRVWWMYVAGVSVKDIAHKVLKDERSVHNAIYRIRRKLRTLLAEKLND